MEYGANAHRLSAWRFMLPAQRLQTVPEQPDILSSRRRRNIATSILKSTRYLGSPILSNYNEEHRSRPSAVRFWARIARMHRDGSALSASLFSPDLFAKSSPCSIIAITTFAASAQRQNFRSFQLQRLHMPPQINLSPDIERYRISANGKKV